MTRTIVVPAELGGAALDELKGWLALTRDAEDALLTGLLASALDAAEAFTGTMPLVQTCEEIRPAARVWHVLGTRPIGAITSVESVAADGTRHTLPIDAYQIELAADGTGSVRVTGATQQRIAVRFVAGLAPAWTSLPEGLRHGVVRLAAHLYRERDGDTLGRLPSAVSALWRPWRRMRIA